LDKGESRERGVKTKERWYVREKKRITKKKRGRGQTLEKGSVRLPNSTRKEARPRKERLEFGPRGKGTWTTGQVTQKKKNPTKSNRGNKNKESRRGPHSTRIQRNRTDGDSKVNM